MQIMSLLNVGARAIHGAACTGTHVRGTRLVTKSVYHGVVERNVPLGQSHVSPTCCSAGLTLVGRSGIPSVIKQEAAGLSYIWYTEIGPQVQDLNRSFRMPDYSNRARLASSNALSLALVPGNMRCENQ